MKKVEVIREFASSLREILVPKFTKISLAEVLETLQGRIRYADVNCVEIRRLENENFEFEIVFPEKVYSDKELTWNTAHAIGHLFIHMNYIVDEDKWLKTDSYKDSAYYRFGHGIDEYEANEFACTFLMSESEFHAIAKSNKDSERTYDLEKISEYFCVEIDYVIARGRSLGLFQLTP